MSPEQGFTALIHSKIDSLDRDTQANAGLQRRKPPPTASAGSSGAPATGGYICTLELGGQRCPARIAACRNKKNLQTIMDQVKAKYPDCKIVIAGMMALPNLGSYATDLKIFPH
ncbi:MAG: hypothetical protein IPJ82_21185 [Lewinellaceae bacterium]|nr:hypothetical protein [Lewinellaceae bacterium]